MMGSCLGYLAQACCPGKVINSVLFTLKTTALDDEFCVITLVRTDIFGLDFLKSNFVLHLLLMYCPAHLWG